MNHRLDVLLKGAIMSNPIQSLPTPTGEFQAHFGGPPGASDAKAECKKWETLCGELLAERQKLRDEYAQLKRKYDACTKALCELKFKDYDPPVITDEEALACLDQNPTLDEIIQEWANTPGK
jgi:hypothetical protein